MLCDSKKEMGKAFIPEDKRQESGKKNGVNEADKVNKVVWIDSILWVKANDKSYVMRGKKRWTRWI